MNKACVIGWPITHSRSPLIHNYWIAEFGLKASYEKVPVEPDKLEDFFSRLKKGEFVGCNVTIPHKESALKFIEQPDDRVRKIGAANTLYRRNGIICATSTDGDGFYENLLAHVPKTNLSSATICILGAGGAARAIVERLLEEEPKAIYVFNRTLERANQLVRDFGSILKPTSFDTLPEILPSTSLLVNTTSLGMTGHQALDIPIERLPKGAIVSDIVYVPLKTRLIERAQSLGLATVPGLGMLLHQAVNGFELWFGVRPQVSKQLYDIVARDIDPGYKS